jgi:hypothetical protein
VKKCQIGHKCHPHHQRKYNNKTAWVYHAISVS